LHYHCLFLKCYQIQIPICAALCQIDPHPCMHCPYPLSKKDYIEKSFLTHLIPSYDPSAVPYLHWVTLNKTIMIQELCSYLFTFQSSALFSSKTFTSNYFFVVINMGWSITCTHNINDFELNTYTASHPCMLTGISCGLNIVGSGFVDWTFPDTNSKPVILAFMLLMSLIFP